MMMCSMMSKEKFSEKNRVARGPGRLPLRSCTTHETLPTCVCPGSDPLAMDARSHPSTPPPDRFDLGNSSGGDDDDDDDDDAGDVYRGSPPPPGSMHSRTRTRSLRSTASTSSSSSSSSSSSVGGPLGAIAGVVERAIARWARGNASDDSLSTVSSSTSASTLRTYTRPSLGRRRRRQSSIASSLNAQSEREIAARRRARELERKVPREFTLYVPPALRADGTPGATNKRGKDPVVKDYVNGNVHPFGVTDTPGVYRSELLQPLLATLDTAMKKSAKAKRQQRQRTPQGGLSAAMAAPPLLRKPQPPPTNVDPAPAHKNRKGKSKGKERAGDPQLNPTIYAQAMTAHHNLQIPADAPASSASSSTTLLNPPEPDHAWWLDVANPTWEDMRTIGNVRRRRQLLTAAIDACPAAPSPSAHPRRHPAARDSREARALSRPRILLYCL
jgi:magnesium transporter